MITIGITMGCPAGIGPEIICRYFRDPLRQTEIQPVVLGDLTVLKKIADQLCLPTRCVDWRPGTPIANGTIPVLQTSSLESDDIIWGSPNRATGQAMVRAICTGVQLAQDGILQGLTTCPISKESLQQTGHLFPGHTEMLASLTNTTEYAMMMAGKRLKITLVTIHRPLNEVPASITTEAITRLITITNSALRRDFGINHPRIGVAGLNPHAGENGLFGHEEQLFITPAVTIAMKRGINASGPYPPDTIFNKAVAGEFDAVIAMYHDQGLIPFKLLHFVDGVNVTLGLPIIRTSVDHGTAYDIAGKGLANYQSLAEAVNLAGFIYKNRTANFNKTHK